MNKFQEFKNNLTLEELAELMVFMREINEGDYDWDENPIDYYVPYYFLKIPKSLQHYADEFFGSYAKESDYEIPLSSYDYDENEVIDFLKYAFFGKEPEDD